MLIFFKYEFDSFAFLISRSS